MKKRVLAIILAAVMMLSLAACAKTPAASGSGDDVSKAPEKEKPTEISFLWAEGGGTLVVPEDAYQLKYILENTNIDYKVIPLVGMYLNEKQAMLMASGEIPDIMESWYENTTDMRKFGAITPLLKYMTKDYVPALIEQTADFEAAVGKLIRSDGELWEIPVTFYTPVDTYCVIRKDWLEAVGKSMPTTVEELVAVLNAFGTEDPDGNGKDDTFGTNSGAFAGNNVMCNMGANPMTLYYNDDCSQVVAGFTLDRFEAAQQVYRDLLDNRGMNPEVIYETAGADVFAAEEAKAGKIGFWDGYCSEMLTYPTREESQWVIMPSVKGVYDKGYLNSMGSGLRQTYVISRECEKAGKLEKALFLLNYLCDAGPMDNIDYDKPFWSANYGEKDVNWTVIDGMFYKGQDEATPENIKANNEGKNYMNGGMRRFRPAGDWAALNSSKTAAELADAATVAGLAKIAELGVQAGAPAALPYFENPEAWQTFSKNVEIAFPPIKADLLLGKLTPAEAVARYREEAEKFGYTDAIAALNQTLVDIAFLDRVIG